MKKELVWLIALTVVVFLGFGGMGVHIKEVGDSNKGLSKEDIKKVIDENPLYFAESFKGVMIALQQKKVKRGGEAELKKMDSLLKIHLSLISRGKFIWAQKEPPSPLLSTQTLSAPIVLVPLKPLKPS